MKLRLWVKILLSIIFITSFTLLFADSLTISFCGLAGMFLVSIPFAKWN